MGFSVLKSSNACVRLARSTNDAASDRPSDETVDLLLLAPPLEVVGEVVGGRGGRPPATDAPPLDGALLLGGLGL